MHLNGEQKQESRRKAIKKLSLVGLLGMGGIPTWAVGKNKMTGQLNDDWKTVNHGAPLSTTSKIRFAVSTYSYWHFEPTKYPIEKVIEHASDLGFDGVEILHRQMESESVPYMNKLKRMAFDRGLALPLLSIHQNFLQPDNAKGKLIFSIQSNVLIWPFKWAFPAYA